MKHLSMSRLENLVTFKTGKLNSNAAKPDGEYPFFTCSQETFRTDTWSFDGEYVLLAGNNAAGVYPLKYFNGRFDAYQRTYAIQSRDENKLQNRFLFYALKPQLELLKSISTGAATKFLTLTLLNQTEIHLPEVHVQKQIISILSTYDDLIENNLRRIKILEEMAQNLYREWFVKFRFPGHEQVRMVDSTLGKVPAGWEVMSVSEAVNLNPKLNIEKDKEKFFVPMSGLSTDSMVITEFKYRTGNNGAKFQNGDTLFARITPSTEHGKTSFVQCLTSDDEVAFGSTEYIVMRSKNLNPYAVYFLARELDFREHAIRSMTGASGRQRVQVSCFDYFFVAASTQDVLDKFEQAVTPNFRLIQNLWDKNRALHQTRDLLLPKLISGELDVSELDIDIGEAA